MNKKIFGTISFILLVIVLVTGCNQPPETQAFEVTVVSPTLSSGYPPPQNSSANSPYPAQDSTPANQVEPTQAANLPEPTQNPDLGRVTGALFNNTGGGITAVAGRTLYLAPIIKNEDGVSVVAALDRQTNPKALTTAGGEFVFVNVDNGEYGLILDLVIESFLLNQPESEDSLVIQISNGDTIELGDLVYEDIPLPPE